MDGQPNLCGSGYAVITYKYDSFGRKIREACFGTDGMPVLSTETGAASMEWEYNRYGDCVKTAYFDTQGKPITCSGGYATCERVFDLRGNTIEERYYGPDGKLALNNNGLAIYRGEYDDYSRWASGAYFDTDDKPVLRKDTDCARQENERDAHGNMTEVRYYDTDGTFYAGDRGYAVVRYYYNERGITISDNYFADEITPSLSKTKGCHKTMRTYDARGNMTGEKFYGTDGKPVISAYGDAQVAQKFDAFNRKTSTAYFGTDGQPIVNEEKGYHEITWTYDGRGNTVENCYLGAGGKPIAVNGNASTKSEFDAYDRRIVYQTFDADGQQQSIWNDSFDSATGKKTGSKWQGAGAATENKYSYTRAGNLTTEEDVYYYNGELSSTTKRVYDEYGYLVSATYFNAEDKLTSSIKYEYGPRGERLEERRYGADGNLANNGYDSGLAIYNDWYARLVITYDRFGNKETQATFSADGKPNRLLRYNSGGNKDGECLFYYSKGEKHDAIRFADDVPVGEIVLHVDDNSWIAYTADGKGKGEGKAYEDGVLVYEGMFQDFLPNGRGKYLYGEIEEGSARYEGEFVDGLPEGQGVMTIDWDAEDFTFTIDGVWKEGIYYTHSGAVLFDVDDPDAMQWWYEYDDGSHYVGSWKDGKIEGMGIMFYSGGDYYEGNWKDGKANGQGTYYLEDGRYYTCEWKEGKPAGTVSYHHTDGGVVRGYWDEDGNWINE